MIKIMVELTPKSTTKLNQLIASINENIDKYSKSKVVFVFGCMGAGKSTFMEKNFKEQTDMVFVSIDDYFHELHTEDVSIEHTYLQCREIGILFTDWLLDNKISLLTEGTGQHSDILDYLKRLLASGYVISSYFLKTPLETCLERVKERNKMIDRKVSPESVKYAFKQLWGCNMVKIADLSNDVYLI